MTKKKKKDRLELIGEAIENLKPEVELLELQVRYYFANEQASQIEAKMKQAEANTVTDAQEIYDETPEDVKLKVSQAK